VEKSPEPSVHQRARLVIDGVDETGFGLRGQRMRRRAPFNADGADALAAGDAQIVGRDDEAGTQQANEERLLARRAGRRRAVEHLDELDRIRRAVALDDVETSRVAAMVLHAPLPGTVKAALWAVRSRSTT
jgi:hypothetical protein